MNLKPAQNIVDAPQNRFALRGRHVIDLHMAAQGVRF
jgi:hypothetical protein